jgi:putative transposase
MGFATDRVTTLFARTLGKTARHRTNVYLNNRLEQDHRWIKGRIGCIRGFKNFDAADRFCREHDELRDVLRARAYHNQPVSVATGPGFANPSVLED